MKDCLILILILTVSVIFMPFQTYAQDPDVQKFFNELNARETDDARKKADDAAKVIDQKYREAQSKSQSPSTTSTPVRTTLTKPALVPKSISTTTKTDTYNRQEVETQIRRTQNDFKTTSSPNSSVKSSFKKMSTPSQANVANTSSSYNSNTNSYTSEKSYQTTITQSYNLKKTNTVVQKYNQYHENVKKINITNQKPVYSITTNNTKLIDKPTFPDNLTEQFLWNKMTETYQGLELSIKTLNSPIYKKGVAELGNIAPENKLIKTLKETPESTKNGLKLLKFTNDYTAGELGDEGKAAKAKAELVGTLKKAGAEFIGVLTKGHEYLDNVRKHGIIGIELKGFYENTIDDIKNVANKIINNGFYCNPDELDKFTYRRINKTKEVTKKGIETMRK